jgi:hypothetical protein
MSDQVSIEFPRQDVRALWAQIDRAQKELGKGLGQAIRFAAFSVAQSLGVRTRVAPKYRRYSEIKEGRGVAKGKGGKKYKITSWKKGSKNTFNVRAASVKELKQKRQVIIANAGLAKSAWYWGIKQIGGGKNISMKGVNPKAKQRGERNMETTSRLRGDDPFVKIVNSLPYAASALRGGMAAVNGVMGKAARYMEHVISGKIEEKLGAK